MSPLNKKYPWLTPSLARRELSRRKKLAEAADPSKLFDARFPQQRAFVEDPANLKALWCTRRAAKSFTAGLYMVSEALKYPGSNILFIGLTRASAKEIIWKDILVTLNRRHGLGAVFNKSELTMTFPNRSVISVKGVDVDEEESLKLLGKKYRLVCIDEASMYTINTRNLVYGVLRPAMVDPNTQGLRGTICMMGTSSNFPRGLFYDVTTGKEPGWSIHTWGAHDNPFVSKQWAEELEEIQRLRPLYMETPQFKQFYLNQWVVDEDKLVYKLSEGRNLYSELPKTLTPDGWTYILGVDTGWEDDNAFVLCAYHQNDPHLFVVKTYNKNHMTFDAVVAKIQEFLRDPAQAPVKVIIDGANKQGVESMRVRSAIPFEYADKQGKVDFIEMLNGDLIQGKVLIQRNNRALIQELLGLVWKTDGDKIAVPKKEHPSLSNHLCDALLYAWRNGYHFHSTTPEKKITKYSKEWYEEQAREIWEREREAIERGQAKGVWGDEGGWGEDL
jgi:phage terminase large subunit